MMRYSYYPGCTLHSSAKDYDQSVKAVCAVLGIELMEVDDWNCCGATAVPSVDQELADILSLRNLARAEAVNGQVVTACNACYLALKRIALKMAEDS